MRGPELKSPDSTGNGTRVHKAYRRILQRLGKSIEAAEYKTWSAIKHDVDQAIELEAAAEEMTREELSLLAAYLKRDLQHFTHSLSTTKRGLAEWLKFDIDLLEDKILALLLSVADKTTVEQNELQQWAQRHPEIYRADEYVMGGTFVCQDCGDNYVYTRPGYLTACVECGNKAFNRITRAE